MKIDSITGLKYANKILKAGRKKFCGSVCKQTASGKSVSLEYKEGLLKLATLSDHMRTSTKEYIYNNQNQLVNVLKNNKPVFEKIIKHNIGINYTRTEIINNEVARTFDEQNRIIDYRVAPKLIFGSISYNGKNRIDTRYFLNQASYEGNGIIKLRTNDGDPILDNGVLDKKIIKDLDTGIQIVIKGDEKTLNTTLNTGNYTIKNEIFTDNNGRPLWQRLLDKNGESYFDQKNFYTPEGHKYKEIYSQAGGKWYIENLFDTNGNIIQERKISSSGETIQTTKSKFNEDNKCTEQTTYDKNNNIVDLSRYIYDKKGNLRCEYTKTPEKSGYSETYNIYDTKGNIIKTGENFNGYKVEVLYDKNGFERKYIVKDKKGILLIKEYINNEEGKIKTIVKNKNKKIKYIIEHSSHKRGEIMTDINVYKSAKGKVLGTEKLKHNNYTGKSDFEYFDKDNKKISYEKMCKLIQDRI